MKNKEYLFSPGPVPISEKVLEIGSIQPMYFRTEEFSNIIGECKKNLLELVNAEDGSEVILLAGSGTAGMEATIMNLFDKNDSAIVINGGGFGQRFVDIFSTHELNYHNIILDKNEKIDFLELEKLNANSFVFNVHETTTGRLYDLTKIGNFCKKYKLLNIVDAISAFVSEKIDMTNHKIDALIFSSNKGLALAPGLAIIILNKNAIRRLKNIKSVYFNFNTYIDNIHRNQTPFTPPISIILQLQYRLRELKNIGIENENKRISDLGKYFRNSIKDLPIELYLNEMAEGMTSIIPTDGKNALKIINDFKQLYNIVLTPSGGDLKDKLIRISHMGEMNKEYIDVLINALKDYYGVNK